MQWKLDSVDNTAKFYDNLPEEPKTLVIKCNYTAIHQNNVGTSAHALIQTVAGTRVSATYSKQDMRGILLWLTSGHGVSNSYSTHTHTLKYLQHGVSSRKSLLMPIELGFRIMFFL